MDPVREPRMGMTLAGLLLCLAVSSPQALETIGLQLGELRGEGWRLGEATLQLDLSAGDGYQASLRIGTATLPDPLGQWQRLELRCTDLAQAGAVLHCRRGTLRADSRWLGSIAGNVRWMLDRGSGALDLSLNDLAVLEGRLNLDLGLHAGGWDVALELDTLTAGALRTLLEPWYPWPADWQAEGRLSGTMQFGGDGTGLNRVAGELRLTDLEYANGAGTQAGQGLRGILSMAGSPRQDGWQGEMRLRVEAGQLYADPLYFDFGTDGPLEARAGAAIIDGRKLEVSSFHWQHADILEAEGEAEMMLRPEPSLARLRLAITRARFPSAFGTYLQPLLVDTSFAELRTSGELQGELQYEDGNLSRLRLDLDAMGIDDPRGRIRLDGLSGHLDWADDDISRQQRIAWRGGHLYRLTLGTLEAELASTGRRLTLARPAQLPVLDGKLLVDRFDLRYGEDLAWSLDAALTPISMPEFTGRLEWPEMAGTLSGMIPDVEYADGELKVGGTLLVRVFDGDITVRNLRLEQPLGLVPRLWADIGIDGLDLETLTRTFAFGKIEGRVDGAVRDLYLETWQPVAFDAWLATPEHDDSRHRISQRAVDNLTNLGGGGVGGALSRGFLRFLEDFPYQALGVKCRLENGICHMGGVTPAAQGYYLVKGRFIPPRINVIGYEDRVDWDTLLDRLRAVTSEQGPVVQ